MTKGQLIKTGQKEETETKLSYTKFKHNNWDNNQSKEHTDYLIKEIKNDKINKYIKLK